MGIGEPKTEVKFDYHREGGWTTLQVGETKVDFENGVVLHPDGDTDKLTESLKKHPAQKHCRSFHLEVRDQDLHVRLDDDEAIHTVEADDVWDATGFHFKVMYLTAPVAGCDIKLTASTSIYGFSSFWPVKKKLDEIQDGGDGDFDDTTDSLHDLRLALDAATFIETEESDWTTSLDGNEQDVVGSASSPQGPPGDTTVGYIRIYPDLVNMGATDTVVFKFYRENDGSNLRQVDSVTYSAAQTNDAPMMELRVTTTRKGRITVQRTAGSITDLPIGIEISTV